ncbi:phosphatidylinositol-glycan biosynthesis class S protein-domain-containing protein [Hygrophoropsis aurantiaca]|uniref:Phosphatidylinositol-glycan biosynthesis class S protein-domain-containing protein n=1 Tax=Hygrophoropsis aurantiaca TaxID=72124 RepID=A0ACB8A294_9AGAM|nr:phosphatidylinositol-glycan biosynthesis class S protein-domain-containing protein [Hygrophoropsis aurantiaca]
MDPSFRHKSGLRNPSSIPFESAKTRRYILASYWVIILLAIPFWWHTTSIERLSLPADRVRSQLNQELRFPIILQFDESSPWPNTTRITDVTSLLQKSAQSTPQRWHGLDIHTKPRQIINAAESPYTYSISVGPATKVGPNRHLTLSERDARSVFRVGDILADLIAPYSTPQSTPIQEQRVAQYAPRYRLAFTLLNEDAGSDQVVTGWDVQNAIETHMSSILSKFTGVHNFTIESQVQFHAPLAFEPCPINLGDHRTFGLTQEDLTVFINSAEWTLSSSVSNDPVLHFLLFVPSADRKPLHILDHHGHPTNRNAFLLPQWGGIFILNTPFNGPKRLHLSEPDLQPVFSAFSSQLSALLGLPPLPRGVSSADPAILSHWQLDALVRRRAIENIRGTQDTLHSIIKLVDQIDNMPVGPSVRDDVQDALAALSQAYENAAASPATVIRWSSEAASLASRAFFNPGMLAMLYFPAEHKYAVYTPLFASIAVPLVVALLREVWAWRKSRRMLRPIS